MAVYYVDTDLASGAEDGSSWTDAEFTIAALETGESPGRGDRVYIQGSTSDSVAATRTFNSYVLIGCVDGTTNIEASMVEADLATKANGPTITNSGAASDLNFQDGFYAHGIDFASIDRNINEYGTCLEDCTITNATDRIQGGGVYYNSTLDSPVIAFSVGRVDIVGGALQGPSFQLLATGSGYIDMVGVDVSAVPTITKNNNTCSVKMTYCLLGTSYALFSSSPTEYQSSVELIGCREGTTAIADDASMQNYEFESMYGSVDNSTENRTGGADDGATGAWSYAMAPTANAEDGVLNRGISTPWMDVFVAGGSKTITTYFTNATGNLDENQVSMTLLTPNSDDSSIPVMTIVPTRAKRIIPSATAIATDASVWSVSSDFPQKLESTLTFGFTGWARVKITYMKTSGAVLYVDSKIGVS